MSIVFDLERTNQLSLLPDKDLVDLCPPIEPYQVTKNRILQRFSLFPNSNNKKAPPRGSAFSFRLGINH